MKVSIKTLIRMAAATVVMIVAVLPMPTVALTVSRMTPASGSMSGGNLVTIKGEDFMRDEPERFIDLAAGVEHAVLLSQTGHVWTVGCNGFGQLGNGSSISKCVVTPIDITDSFNLDSDDYIVSVASGDYHSFAISNNHRVLAWGRNFHGQLGDGTVNNQYSPVDITDNISIDDNDYIEVIEGGAETSIALTNGGDTLFWGDTTDYQDGQAEIKYAPQTTPAKAPWLDEYDLDISLGYKSGIFINGKGMVGTWGRNTNGELGRTKGDELNKSGNAMPAYYITDNLDLIEGDEVIDVEAGNGVMMVITKYGQVYIWGDDRTGMLGIGGEVANPNDPVSGLDYTSTPKNITDLFDLTEGDLISQVSIGNSSVIALSQYGQVYTWGAGMYGQIGDGLTVGRQEITNITEYFELNQGVTIEKVLASGAGDNLIASYVYAIDSDGAVYAWGGSAKGLPGINAISNQPLPTKISNRLTASVSNVAEVKFGDELVDEIDVVGNETVQVIAPPSILAGDVTVTITDNDGARVELVQKYKYINTDSVSGGGLDDDSNSDNNGVDDNSGENDDNGYKNNKNDNSLNSSSGDDSDDQPDEESLGDEQLDIEAPNTGVNL